MLAGLAGGDAVIYGTFSGNPRTEWLPDGRNMRLLERFTYTDPSGREWVADAGRIINGASIPRPLWAITGSPYTGLYRNASIVHDVACEDHQTVEDRRAADTMFYWACRCGGVGAAEALKLYLGVRIGTDTDAVEDSIHADVRQACDMDLSHGIA